MLQILGITYSMSVWSCILLRAPVFFQWAKVACRMHMIIHWQQPSKWIHCPNAFFPLVSPFVVYPLQSLSHSIGWGIHFSRFENPCWLDLLKFLERGAKSSNKNKVLAYCLGCYLGWQISTMPILPQHVVTLAKSGHKPCCAF